jgi:hypothetical protein
MKRYVLLLVLAAVVINNAADAQFGGYGRMRRTVIKQKRDRNHFNFSPSASFSVGYGFPNQDQNLLYQFNNYNQGPVNQNGLIHGSMDYQFTRNSSFGVMVSHGKVSASYYDYSSSSPALGGSLESWAVMLNMMRYMQFSNTFSGYMRTAIGVNLWTQEYTDSYGNKQVFNKPPMMAYQTGIGLKVNVNKHTGLFVEAGYGKYIVSGGLTFKLLP